MNRGQGEGPRDKDYFYPAICYLTYNILYRFQSVIIIVFFTLNQALLQKVMATAFQSKVYSHQHLSLQIHVIHHHYCRLSLYNSEKDIFFIWTLKSYFESEKVPIE